MGEPGARRTRWKRLILGMLALGITLFCWPWSTAQAASPTVIRVGYFAFEGYHELAVDGTRSGYGYELLQRIARYENIVYEYVGYDSSWEELQQKLLDGEIDLLTSARKTPEREERFAFSDLDVGQASTLLTVKSGNQEIVAGDYDTYDGMKVGMLRGSTRGDSFRAFARANGFSYTSVQYRTEKQLTNALQNGEVDAIVSSNVRRMTNEWVMERFDEEPIYAITRKDDLTTLHLVNDALEKMDRYESGWRQAMSQKYYVQSGGVQLPFSAEEESYLAHLNRTKAVFTAVVETDRYPYAYLDENGNPTGALIDVFGLVAKRAGIRCRILGVANQSALAEVMAQGEADIVLDLHEGFSHAEQYGYKSSDAYVTGGYSWVMKKSTTGRPQTAAAIRGIVLDQPWELPEGIQYRYYPTEEACLDALRSGAVDAYYTYSYHAEKLVFDDLYNDLRTTLAPRQAAFCLGVRDTLDVRLLSTLNKGINSLDQPTVQRVVDGYADLGKQDFSWIRLSRQYPLILALLILCALLTTAALLLMGRSHRLQRSLVQAVARAEEASRAKTAFLSNMSHDIRTPMNGIVGMMDIAQENLEDPRQVENCLQKMRGAADHLLSLINDVLDMSKIEAGGLELLEESFDLRLLLDACCSIVEGSLEGRDLTFRKELPPLEHPCLRGSPLHLRQILLNVLGNAVKYTPDGGRVIFRAAETGYAEGQVSLCFVTEDTGVGMSREFLQKIFEPFSQEHGGSRSTYQGTGLGMAITKSLVERMGGQITVESEVGKGSVFRITLTLPQGDPAELLPTLERDDIDLTGVRILLAEDNPLNREVAETLLLDAGATVTSQVNGRLTVDAWAQAPDAYDIILMDVMMPEMDGLEATRSIRQKEREWGRPAAIPILAMTANVFAADIRACQEAGMNGHVGKPIDLRRIAAEILRLLRPEQAHSEDTAENEENV